MNRKRWPLLLLILLALAGCSKTEPAANSSAGDLLTPGPPDEPRQEATDKEAPRPEESTVPPNSLRVLTPQGEVVHLPANHDPWADRVVSYTPGQPKPEKDNDPKEALGPPNFRRKQFPRHSVSLGRGGELVLEFVDNVLIDGPGDDLVIFEVGARVEPMDVWISTDGKEWIALGSVRAKSTLDIGPFVKPGQQFRFVKLKDLQTPKGKTKGPVPGADIDAVGALHSLPVAR